MRKPEAGKGIHNDAKKGRFGVLSVPYNAEHTVTAITDLQGAGKSLSPQQRQGSKVQIIQKDGSHDYKDPYLTLSLVSVHELLSNRHRSADVYQSVPEHPDQAHFAKPLQNALDR